MKGTRVPPRLPQTHSLMPLLSDPRRLKHAARGCMRTCSAAGADGLTWRDYRTGMNTRIHRLARQLRSGTWKPGPIRQTKLPAGDKQLTITIPTVEDRIVHRALRHCAEPILGTHAYPEWLFGWRPRRGRAEALAYLQRNSVTSPCWVADIDITRATTGCTVEETVGWLAEWIHDGSFLAIIRQILDALPSPLVPGTGLSPLLTNLRLLQVDRQLSAATVARVTDNYVIFCPDQTEAQHRFRELTDLLARQALAPHPTKSKVWRPNLEDLFLAG